MEPSEKPKVQRSFINAFKVRPDFHAAAILGAIFGLLLIAITAVFIFLHFYHTSLDAALRVLTLDERQALLLDELFWDLVLSLSMLMGSMAILIVILLSLYLFRITGAEHAINRHIREKILSGDYTSRLKLRKGDLLNSIADSLNELSEKLGSR